MKKPYSSSQLISLLGLSYYKVGDALFVSNWVYVAGRVHSVNLIMQEFSCTLYLDSVIEI